MDTRKKIIFGLNKNIFSGFNYNRRIICTVFVIVALFILDSNRRVFFLHAQEKSKPVSQLSVEEQVERKRLAIVRTALALIGTPYRYGGVTPSGFDCCGFVMFVYRRNGVTIPRTAGDQYSGGRSLNPDELQKGDLVFFDIRRHGVSHVGIYIGDGKFIHSPVPGRRVRTERLEWPYWQRHYAGAASYLD